MFYMMVLANVEGFVVSLAVGGMVADGLHAKLLTLLDHDVCVGATCLSGGYRSKENVLLWHAIAAAKHS
jgi:hypothetical protein